VSASGVIHSATDRILAEREVEDLEREAATFWRLAGAVEGQRSRFVDESLRDRLVEALAELSAIGEGKVREAISEQTTEIARLDDKHAIGDGFESQIQRVCSADPEQWPERVADLIDSLGERIAEQREEIGRLKEDRTAPSPPPSNVRLIRPGARSGKPRLGATTRSLFPDEEPVVVREVMPTPIGKVSVDETVKRKRGRPRKVNQ